MPWWRKSETDGTRRGNDGSSPNGVSGIEDALPSGRSGVHDLMPLLQEIECGPRPVNTERLADALRRLDVHFLTDPTTGNLVAMWERHAVMFALEGPEQDILMVRARAHGTVPPEWADRAYPAMNSWNHDRRFLKAYVGDPSETGRMPLYAEMQIPMVPGVHDQLLDEFLGCAVDVAEAWVDWLHTEGAVL